MIIAIIILAFLLFTPAGNQLSGIGKTTTTSGSNQVVVTKPLSISCVDPIAAANCGAVTIKIFQGTSPTVLETLTASSTGVATSNNKYTSGTQLTLQISGNGKVTEFLSVVVPTGYVTDTNIIINAYAVTLGSWAQTFTGTGGTTFVSGNTYFLNQFPANTVTVTDSISETSTNAGYKSSYDIVNLLNQYFLVQVSDGGGAAGSTQYATVTGLPHNVKSGNVNYYFVICPDGLSGSGIGSPYQVVSGSQSAGSSDPQCSGSGLTQYSSGNVVLGGSVGFSFTLQPGSLTAGNVETFTFKMFIYADPQYFLTNGNLGPNAVQTGSTFTLNIRSS
jgi:hypothetical protein